MINILTLHAFIPINSTGPVGMGFAQKIWVKLSSLRTGVGQFHLSIDIRGLATLPNCVCGTLNYIPRHNSVPYISGSNGPRGLTIFGKKARCWLNTIIARI